MNINPQVLVSVVIPTYQRPDLLRRCLQAVLVQDVPPDCYEIIVVDDGAGEDTRRVVEDERARSLARRQGPIGAETPPLCPRLRYLPMRARSGPAAARNAGWRAGQGEIIAFTDDDTVPATGWLSAGLRALQIGADGVAGKVVVPLPRRPTDYERSAAGLERSRFVTANCFYRRAALETVGGFDERFGMAWREDSDLQFCLEEAGYRLIDAPQAVVFHPVRPAPWGISLDQQRKSMYNALLYKKHPQRYRRLQASPPWHYYLTVACLLAAPLAAAAGRPGVAQLALLAWLVLTLRFTLARLRLASHAPSHIAEMFYTSMLIPLLSIFWRIRGALKYRVWFL